MNKQEKQKLIEQSQAAQRLALPPVSGFHVGAALMGASGKIYQGFNIELPFLGMGGTIHAEQTALSRAFSAGEKGVQALAITASPCGHCRQFLKEALAPGEDLLILLPDKEYQLSDLLPESFGPEDLEQPYLFEGKALGEANFSSQHCPSSPLAQSALHALHHSHAPYSEVPIGVAIQTPSNTFTGSSCESAAFNPSLHALQIALIELLSESISIAEVSQIILYIGVTSPSRKDLSDLYLAHSLQMAEKLFPKAQVTGELIPCKFIS